MRTHALSSTTILAALFLCACGSSADAGGAASSSAKPTAATAATPGGRFEITSEFAKLDQAKVEVGQAWAQVNEDSITITLLSKTAAGVKPCDSLFGAEFVKTAGDVALEMSTRGTSYTVPFEGKAGTYEHVGYTMYYLNGAKGTNSGNSARADLPTKLVIDSIDGKLVKGSFDLGFSDGKAAGSFTAQICE